LEALNRAGGRRLTVITGADETPRDVQIAAFIDNLRRVTPRLEAADAMICLEPTSDQRIQGLLLNDLDDAYAVACAVDSPHVRLLFDTLHIQQAHGDVISNLRRVWDRVGAVQIADNPGRLEPGSGEINFVSLILALLELGHTGLICLEHQNAVPGAAGELLALERLRAIDGAVDAQRRSGR
jgi:hydroxypyruvate isomerase